MIGRKKNRRRTEPRKPWLKVPALAANVRRRIKLATVPFVAVAIVYGALEGGRALLDHPVRKLVVEGTFQRITPLQVEAAVAADLGRGFLSLDLADLRARVKALDWVDRVSVGRAWPDTLTVRVVEHQAAARWGTSGLLNVRGELFTRSEEHAFPELPNLAGPEGSEQEVARRYLAVRGRLVEAGLALERLSMDERGAWSLVLASGQEIRLGRRDVDERLDRFFTVVAPALASDFARVRYVDLRYTNGFAVGWRASAEGALAAASAAPDRG